LRILKVDTSTLPDNVIVSFTTLDPLEDTERADAVFVVLDVNMFHHARSA